MSEVPLLLEMEAVVQRRSKDLQRRLEDDREKAWAS